MSDLLKRINSIEDMRCLEVTELEQLAAEIRDYMLTVVAKNGGHLASNLGVVELTIALHSVFSVPEDKIIWDVGHQCYAHKILTGRREEFATLRTFGGISGFPSLSEGPADCFETGHSSTSISAAMGLATARDLAGQNHQVVAVIGDGALTGGMVYEALNHAGARQTRLLVVLNDNEMSIANNVGAISHYLTRLRSHPRYYRAKKRAFSIIGRVPKLGEGMQRLLERMKHAIKYFFMSRMLFEELGFIYYGPIDGHDIKQLTEMLSRAKQIEHPVLLHVLTKKGRGYAPAEQNPQIFHGAAPFDPATGLLYNIMEKPSYTKVFGETMLREAASRPSLMAISAAMTDGVGLLPFAALYPQRFFDVGIAEAHAVTFAAGLASGGYKPVVAIYSSFLQRAYDQILHDVCLPCLPVVFALDRAGLVGEDGATHQGMYDLSYLRSMPNLRLLSPGDGAELAQMLVWALDQPYPVAIRYPRGCPEYTLPRHDILQDGRASLLHKGNDVLLMACGSMVGVAMAAADLLAEQGIMAAVINARFITPLDKELLRREAAVSKCVLTLEENVGVGGFGAACLEALRDMPVYVDMVALPRQPIPHGPTPRLKSVYGLTPEQVAERAEILMHNAIKTGGCYEG